MERAKTTLTSPPFHPPFLHYSHTSSLWAPAAALLGEIERQTVRVEIILVRECQDGAQHAAVHRWRARKHVEAILQGKRRAGGVGGKIINRTGVLCKSFYSNVVSFWYPVFPFFTYLSLSLSVSLQSFFLSFHSFRFFIGSFIVAFIVEISPLFHLKGLYHLLLIGIFYLSSPFILDAASSLLSKLLYCTSVKALRKGERERERETDRETDRQTDRQRERDIDKCKRRDCRRR